MLARTRELADYVIDGDVLVLQIDNILTGFPIFFKAFFAVIPPKYPLIRAFKNTERWFTRGIMLSCPPGGIFS